MFRQKDLTTSQSNVEQITAETNKLISFDALVTDRSLSPVRVKISRSKKKKLSIPPDTMLTELQCEV